MTDSRPTPIELADGRDRALACAEFARPLAVQAGAGTGKTRTLVARIGTWLLGPGWEQAAAEMADERDSRGAAPAAASEVAARACEGVVAITFTDAAAAEMADRVERMLGQAASGAEIDDLERLPTGVSAAEARQRAASLIAVSARLRISTIHGFCHRLLAEFPIEAGLHPGFRIDADDELTLELATAVVLDLLRQNDAGLVGLLAAGVDPPQLLAALRKLVQEGVRAEDLEADPFAGDALGERVRMLRAATAALLEVARPLRVEKCLASIADGLAALERLDASLAAHPQGAISMANLEPALAESREQAGKIFESWAKGRFGKAEANAIDDLAELRRRAATVAREHAALAEIDPDLLLQARAALVGPLRRLAGRRRSEGVLSFDDLLERAVALLTDDASVLARVRRGMRQLLVDEFQDTDRRQCELVRSLVLADEEEPGREPAVPRAGWSSTSARCRRSSTRSSAPSLRSWSKTPASRPRSSVSSPRPREPGREVSASTAAHPSSTGSPRIERPSRRASPRWPRTPPRSRPWPWRGTSSSWSPPGGPAGATSRS